MQLLHPGLAAADSGSSGSAAGAAHLVDVLAWVCCHSILQAPVSMTPVHSCPDVPAHAAAVSAASAADDSRHAATADDFKAAGTVLHTLPCQPQALAVLPCLHQHLVSSVKSKQLDLYMSASCLLPGRAPGSASCSVTSCMNRCASARLNSVSISEKSGSSNSDCSHRLYKLC